MTRAEVADIIARTASTATVTHAGGTANGTLTLNGGSVLVHDEYTDRLLAALDVTTVLSITPDMG
jgi:hypothetical protein